MVFSRSELQAIFGSVGENVQVDRWVRVVGGKNIHLGSNVRIDAFSSLLATHPIKIGNYTHIGFSSLISSAGGEVVMEDFTAFAPRVSLVTATDGFSADALICVQAPHEFRAVKAGPVRMEKFSTVGAHSLVLPNVTFRKGSSAGALTVVNKDIGEGEAIVGNPYKLLRIRDINKMEEKARAFINSIDWDRGLVLFRTEYDC